jgi:methyltransferase (TIGR00027 family)
MAKWDPRKAALQIAGLRAIETLLPENIRVFEDPYAEYFFPEDLRKTAQGNDWVKEESSKFEALMPGVNGALVARTRYIDECLLELIDAGLKQIVIIGAGYDTRAHRIEKVKENCKIFEIDHPLTQEVKIKTIKNLFSDPQNHVTYLPMTIGQVQLDKKLIKAGFDPNQKALFIAEGFLMFLPAFAASMLLNFICDMSAPGSVLLADWFSISVVDGSSALKEAKAFKIFVENEGTPLRFGIPDEKAEDYFKKRGFKKAECVNAAWCKEKYFREAGRDRSVSPMFNFVYAVV